MTLIVKTTLILPDDLLMEAKTLTVCRETTLKVQQFFHHGGSGSRSPKGFGKRGTLEDAPSPTTMTQHSWTPESSSPWATLDTRMKALQWASLNVRLLPVPVRQLVLHVILTSRSTPRLGNLLPKNILRDA